MSSVVQSREERLSKSKVDHYLNSIKKSILYGTSRTSIDMSVRDPHTLIRLANDVIPTATLNAIKKPELAKINAFYDEFVSWVETAETYLKSLRSLSAEDCLILIEEFADIKQELLEGDITVKPYVVLANYIEKGITSPESLISDEARELLQANGGVNVDQLKIACQIIEDNANIVTPFPITYLVYADITEVEQLGNSDRAPATANQLREHLSRNFQVMLQQNQLSPHQQMSLYRILGPERQQQKAALEINNNVNNSTQQIVVVKSLDRLKPENLVVGENTELLGVGKSYGNIKKPDLLRLAAGEASSGEKPVDSTDLMRGLGLGKVAEELSFNN